MIPKLKKASVILVLSLSLSGFLLPAFVSAAPPQCNDTNNNCAGGLPSGSAGQTSNFGNGCASVSKEQCLKQSPIVHDLNIVVDFLSGLVGVVVLGVIILGGIQFATAGDKAEAVSAAKKRITNGVIALVAFLFIFAFLQWLIPGGIFG
ncbi:hypothetical protein BVY00_00985 [bacterium G20]|nr:hypothetical protein BVY00_00985 [bacterium G20]